MAKFCFHRKPPGGTSAGRLRVSSQPDNGCRLIVCHMSLAGIQKSGSTANCYALDRRQSRHLTKRQHGQSGKQQDRPEKLLYLGHPDRKLCTLVAHRLFKRMRISAHHGTCTRSTLNTVELILVMPVAPDTLQRVKDIGPAAVTMQEPEAVRTESI